MGAQQIGLHIVPLITQRKVSERPHRSHCFRVLRVMSSYFEKKKKKKEFPKQRNTFTQRNKNWTECLTFITANKKRAELKLLSKYEAILLALRGNCAHRV